MPLADKAGKAGHLPEKSSDIRKPGDLPAHEVETGRGDPVSGSCADVARLKPRPP